MSGDIEPGAFFDARNEAGSLHSIAISLKRIADALTPQDGASSSDLVQQVSEMLDARDADLPIIEVEYRAPWGEVLGRHRFGNRGPVERVAD